MWAGLGTVLAAVLWLAGPARAQSGVGTIEGRLLDQNMVPVSGATVTARNTATNATAQAVTSLVGRYQIDNLVPGTYEVTTQPASAKVALSKTARVVADAVTTADFTVPVARTSKQKAEDEGTFPRVEVAGRAGYTFADGVSGNEILAGDGNVYDSLGPTDGYNWGVTAGLFLTQRFMIEFLFALQQSRLQVDGTRTVDLGDFDTKNYHGLLSYHWGPPRGPLRPYVLAGVGLTHYRDVRIRDLPEEVEIFLPSNIRLSTTWGGGVKWYGGRRLGARLEGRWTPAYIRSTTDGWYCSEFWGCWTTGDAQIANQIEFTGGVLVRF
jgi:outer membrane protein W